MAFSQAAVQTVSYRPGKISPPKLAREYRAAWVATVSNIDWPSTNSLNAAQQKNELLAILDRAKLLGLNTVIFQVRPACDALYPSKLEPWSEYLTGTMGMPPQPYYDPLAFAIEEAHRRGLELHAWFNPYRAMHYSSKSSVSATHISKIRPELVRQYGRMLWLDPGEKDVQEHSLNVVMDVVKRYHIDGVHFDDYFYPYKEKDRSGQDIDFPDASSWERFGKKSNLSRDDWRRQNVDQFIQKVHRSIAEAKPWVKFGISPFGIWRPGYPAQIKGLDAYSSLYADSRKWLLNGWADYLAPQLYWAIDAPQQSFPALLDWWARNNPKDRHLVPGLNSAQTRGKWKPGEITSQIRITRQQFGADGHAHWNMRSLMGNSSLATALRRDTYQEPALVPPMNWLARSAPQKPKLRAADLQGQHRFTWMPSDQTPLRCWVIQVKRGASWTTEILPADQRSVVLSLAPGAVAVTAVDRYGNASAAAALEKVR